MTETLLLGRIIKSGASGSRLFLKILGIVFDGAGVWFVFCVNAKGTFFTLSLNGDAASHAWTLAADTGETLEALEKLEAEGRVGSLGQILPFDKDGDVVPEVLP